VGGADTVHVAEHVELGVVDEQVGAVGGGEGGCGVDDEFGGGVGGDVTAAPGGRPSEVAALVGRVGNVGGGHPGRLGPLVDGAARLPDQGVDVRCPPQVVEDRVGSRQRHLVADDPVATGDSPGAHRGEGGCGRAGESGGDGCAPLGERRQEGGAVAVGE